MTPDERARALCEKIETGMRRMGVVTTAHYETGIPLIAAALRAADAAGERRGLERAAVVCARAAKIWVPDETVGGAFGRIAAAIRALIPADTPEAARPPT